MKHILLLVFSLSLFTIQAQELSFGPDSLIMDLTIDDNVADASFNVSNLSTENSTFYWALEMTNIPDDWTFTICDANLCFPPGTVVCPEGQENVIESGQAINNTYKVSLFHAGVKGIGSTVFRCYDINDSSITYGSIKIDWNVLGGTSVNDLEIENIEIFPNPASNYFTLNNTTSVDQVSVFDFLGKRTKEFSYKEGNTYDISDLSKGIYYVSAYDRKGQMISTKRLIKN